MKNLTNTQIWLLTFVLFIGFGIVGAMDRKDKIAAEEHAKEIQRIAKQAKKDEFNQLAFEAYKKTGFKAAMK